MGALRHEPPAEIDERGLEPVTVEAHADSIGTRRLEPQEGRRLAALALVALTDDRDEAAPDEILHDLADGRVGEGGRTGEIGLRGFAEAAQALQHDAMMIVADTGRRQPEPRLRRARHLRPRPLPRRRRLHETGSLIKWRLVND